MTVDGVNVWMVFGEGKTATCGGRREREVSKPLLVVVKSVFDFVVRGFLKKVSGNEMGGEQLVVKFDLLAELGLKCRPEILVRQERNFEGQIGFGNG